MASDLSHDETRNRVDNHESELLHGKLYNKDNKCHIRAVIEV